MKIIACIAIIAAVAGCGSGKPSRLYGKCSVCGEPGFTEERHWLSSYNAQENLSNGDAALAKGVFCKKHWKDMAP